MDKQDKEMNKMVKRWELWIAACVPQLIVGLVLLYFKFSYTDAKALKNNVDNKVDKIEFIKAKDEINLKADKLDLQKAITDCNDYTDNQCHEVKQSLEEYKTENEKRENIFIKYVEEIRDGQKETNANVRILLNKQ